MTNSAADSKDPPNLGLLIKLMKLTTSSNDSEALLAMRKANEQLSKFGGCWERLLLGRVTVIADPFTSIPTPPPAAPSYSRPSAPQPRAPAPPRPQAPPPPPPPPPSYTPAYTAKGYAQSYRAKRRRSKPSTSDLLNSI